MSSISSSLILLAGLAFSLYFTVSKLLRASKPSHRAAWSDDNKATLPGPLGLPFLGPVNELPRFGSWFGMKAWTDRYGPLIETTILGQKWILIGSHEVADRLLNGRGAIYSSRPAIPSVVDSRSDHGTREYLPLMALNSDHTRHKKFDKITMDVARNQRYYGIPVAEARRLLQHIGTQRTNNTAWVLLTEEFTSKIMCRLAFGSSADHAELRQHTWRFLYHISPAGFLASMIPPINKIPYWLSYWKQAEHDRHAKQQAFFLSKLQQTRQKVLANEAISPSYMKSFVMSRKADSAVSVPSLIEKDSEGAAAIGMVATAAIYTVSLPLQNFIRAIAAFPEYQVRLHAEMDTVIPATRLPELSDIASLPLLRACIKETFRWRPAIPTGIPHELDQDDVVDGHLIKKGTPVFWVEYAMCRDPDRYPRPYEFLPERWLDPAYPSTYSSQGPKVVGSSMFGWGRRACMGQDLTQEELYAACAHLVWAFRVKPTAAGEKVLCKNLGPGEARGGMQIPDKWSHSLILAKPEDLELVWEWRDQARETLAFSPNVLDDDIADE